MARKPSFKIKNGKLICNNRGIHKTFKKNSYKPLKKILAECGVR